METAADVEYVGTVSNVEGLSTCGGKTATIAATYTLLIGANWYYDFFLFRLVYAMHSSGPHQQVMRVQCISNIPWSNLLHAKKEKKKTTKKSSQQKHMPQTT
jgi:hypothetical protein